MCIYIYICIPVSKINPPSTLGSCSIPNGTYKKFGAYHHLRNRRQTKPAIGFIRWPGGSNETSELKNLGTVKTMPCPTTWFNISLLMFIDDCCCLYPCCLSPALLLFCLVKLPLLFGKNHNCVTYPFVLLVCCSDLNWAAQIHVFDHLCWSNPSFVQPIVRRIISILWAGQTCFNGLLTS